MLLFARNETLKLVISVLNGSFKKDDFMLVTDDSFRTNRFTVGNILLRITQQNFKTKFVFRELLCVILLKTLHSILY